MAGERLEQCRNIPPPRALPDKKEEGLVLQTQRTSRLDHLGGMVGERTEPRFRPWIGYLDPGIRNRMDALDVPRGRVRRHDDARCPTRGQAISPAESPANVPGEARWNRPGESVV